MLFKKNQYTIIKNAISKDMCRVFAKEFRISRDLAMKANHQNTSVKSKECLNLNYPFHDEMVENSFSWYSPLCFEALSDTIIKDIVEKEIHEPVYPTYSYARIYYNGAEMLPHIDRSSSEVSVSLCIDVDSNSSSWNLFVLDDNTPVEIYQEPGDIIIYDGNNLKHWREKYQGSEQINAFMFYVRANGPRAELKYDTRDLLGESSHQRKLNSKEQVKKYV
jgi:hypothetical protein